MHPTDYHDTHGGAMEPEAILLIEDAPDAQRLVVTWPIVGPLSDAPTDVFEVWAETSGVDIEDVERWEPILFRNGLLGPGGFVDERVIRFLRAKANAKMPKVPKEADV